MQTRQLQALDQQLMEDAGRIGKVLVWEGACVVKPAVAALLVSQHSERDAAFQLGRSAAPPDPGAGGGELRVETSLKVVAGAPDEAFTATSAHAADKSTQAVGRVRVSDIRVNVEQVGDTRERVLVIQGGETGEKRVALPPSQASLSVRENLRRGVLAGCALLAVGLAGAAYVSFRLTRPLRGLSRGAEALARGELGAQVEASARGELGDLQRTFNRMSVRLAQLEEERARWRARERLAELGGLSRGLAHTLRNPLHTLGLLVEELAPSAGADGERLVCTARAQIRRVDRWLRSFLALGANGESVAEEADLVQVVRDAVLECMQAGHSLELAGEGGPLPVLVVQPALRAALANLMDNAAEASPEGSPVEVLVERADDGARVTVRDRGPGLPEEVKRHLFEPHVTTRPGGSGMGLFLARRLVEDFHGGRLEIGDAPGGGTVAEIRIPLAGHPVETSGTAGGGRP